MIPTKEELIELYINQNLSREEIGKIYDLSPKTIASYCQRMKIHRSVEQIRENRRKTMLERYGVENISLNKEYSKKKSETYKKNYGDKNSKNYHDLKVRREISCLEKYGVKNARQNEDVKNKAKQTYLEKYGCENPMQNKQIANKTGQTQKTRQKKYIQRNIEKYGIERPCQLSEVKNKIIQTKRKNNSFNVSGLEDKMYDKLLQKFSDILRQYKSERYPFCCDFHIVSQDLYIELNFHWTHGKCPFRSNQNCLDKLKRWEEKAKTSKYFQNAVKVWTELDVRKRNIAKQNNLNYLEFFTEQEFMDWYEKL